METLSLKKDAQRVLLDYRKLTGYQLQEDTLRFILKKYPDHSIPEAVETKVKTLNLYYSTNIHAVGNMAKHILSIANIDKRLDKGEASLVNDIARLRSAKGGTRNNYSFATKYCAYHRPTLFPIYDKIVSDIFLSLFRNGKLNGYSYTNRQKTKKSGHYTLKAFSNNLKNYSFYKTVYDQFITQYDLSSFSYRQVDSYLWGAYKIANKQYLIKDLALINTTNLHPLSITEARKKHIIGYLVRRVKSHIHLFRV